MFYRPSYLLFILMSTLIRLAIYNHKQLQPLVTLFCWSLWIHRRRSQFFWLPLPQHSLIASLFSLSSSSFSSTTPPIFIFGGQSLTLLDRTSHLDHILHSDLSDTDDVLRIFKVIYIYATEPIAFYLLSRPPILQLTLLFRTSCLPLYGASLWSLTSPGLCSLEVTFNNVTSSKKRDHLEFMFVVCSS